MIFLSIWIHYYVVALICCRYIKTDAHKMEVAVRPPMAVTNAVSWRMEGIKYKKNEVSQGREGCDPGFPGFNMTEDENTTAAAGGSERMIIVEVGFSSCTVNRAKTGGKGV